MFKIHQHFTAADFAKYTDTIYVLQHNFSDGEIGYSEHLKPQPQHFTVAIFRVTPKNVAA